MIEPRFLTDQWRRSALAARLLAIEEEDYQHTLNQRIGEEVRRSQTGRAREEGAEMVQTATIARQILAVTHAALLAELDALGEPGPGQAAVDLSKQDLEHVGVPLTEDRGTETEPDD